MLTISRLTREYIFTDITTPNDLTSATGEFAFMEPGEIPEELDWETGDILQEAEGWVARILVGDGADVTLASPDTYPYDWQVWLRIDDNPERPVRRPGIITVE
jgi:hypothetical protein